MLPRRSRPEWDKLASSRIREERLRLGVSQDDFAGSLGVDRKTAGRWERGEASPSAAQLAGMTSMGVDVRYVLIGLRDDAISEAPERYHVPSSLAERLAALSPRQQEAIKELVDAFAGNQSRNQAQSQ